jgi:hypothetical protein
LGNRLRQEPEQKGEQSPRRLSSLLPFSEATADDYSNQVGSHGYSLTVFLTAAIYLIAGLVGMRLMAENRVADGVVIWFILISGGLVMLAAVTMDLERLWLRLAMRWSAWLAVSTFTGGVVGNIARVYLHSTSSRLADAALYAILLGVGLGLVGLVLPQRNNFAHWLVLFVVGAIIFVVAMAFRRNVNLISVGCSVLLAGWSTLFCSDARSAIQPPWSLCRAMDLGSLLPLYVLLSVAVLVA